jgi:putative transposase
MPRHARLDAPGILQHVMVRGIEGRDLFVDADDRENLLDRLEYLVPLSGTACYAWALLPNHAHFLLRSGEEGLALLMRRVLTGYAVSFNRRHGRKGHLFQNRYKSIVCQEDSYLKELVRYIHLNPLRGALVENLRSLDSYAYCGHGPLMGKRTCAWQDVDYVLSYFGKEADEARKTYRAFVQAGLGQGRRPELVGGGVVRSRGGWAQVKTARKLSRERLKADERVLGDGSFVEALLRRAEANADHLAERRPSGLGLKTLEKKVSAVFDLEPEDLYAKSRDQRRADARGLFCYWAVRELRYSQTELARRFHMTQPGVAYAVKRGERLVKTRGLTL